MKKLMYDLVYMLDVVTLAFLFPSILFIAIPCYLDKIAGTLDFNSSFLYPILGLLLLNCVGLSYIAIRPCKRYHKSLFYASLCLVFTGFLLLFLLFRYSNFENIRTY